MRFLAISIAILFSAVGFVGAASDAPQSDDLLKLEGRWRLVSVEQNEQRTDLDEGAEVIFVVRRGEIFIQDNKISSIDFPDADSTSSPKLINVSLEGQGTVEGIYELAGNTWQVCINNASQGDSKERPTELSTRGSPNYQLFTFRREAD